MAWLLKFACSRWSLAAFAVVLTTLCGFPSEQRRVALVVGASHYEHAPTLQNTLNDANDMSAALKRLGFEVETLLDPSRQALETAVRDYGRRSIGAEVSLFYYSGHALEAGGRNWILPVALKINTERELPFEAVDLATVVEQTDSAARVSLVFLDACRENPFALHLTAAHRALGSAGLGQVSLSATGVLIAFSTAPGQLAYDGAGRNSPFTEALLKRIETPGLEVKALMARVASDVVKSTGSQQRPWQTSSLEGDFFFVPPSAADAPAPKPPTDLDPIFWQSVKDSKNAADFGAYLNKFPQGAFAELARNRLAALNSAAASAGAKKEAAATAASPPDKPGAAAEFSAQLRDRLTPLYEDKAAALRAAADYADRITHKGLAFALVPTALPVLCPGKRFCRA